MAIQVASLRSFLLVFAILSLHPTPLAAISLQSRADISTDGSCGAASGFTCKGSSFGDCCSGRGYCGSESTYCGAECQPDYGNCPASSASISSDGSCGGDKKITCQGSSFGDCCSAKGFCGSESSYCGDGCQSSFGTCGSASVSSDGTCGGEKKLSCLGSTLGDCCSALGYCGGNSSYCGAGCQTDFGKCGSSTTSSDGTCGGNGKVSCQGSDYGNCCSRLGYCGSDPSYCGDGCQTEFGTCLATGPGKQPVSSDGSCGGDKNITCQGSEYGNCCSEKGFCGAEDAYCGAGCQGSFGTCLRGPGDPNPSGSSDASKSSGALTPSGALNSPDAPSSSGRSKSPGSLLSSPGASDPADASGGAGSPGQPILGSAAVAGITVGSIAGVALFGVAAFLLRRRRRTRERETDSPVPDELMFDKDKVLVVPKSRRELRYELSGDSATQELSAVAPTVETDGRMLDRIVDRHRRGL